MTVLSSLAALRRLLALGLAQLIAGTHSQHHQRRFLGLFLCQLLNHVHDLLDLVVAVHVFASLKCFSVCIIMQLRNIVNIFVDCVSFLCYSLNGKEGETVNIASRVKAVRREAGLNQLDFSKRIGITRQYLSLIESGERSPSDLVKNAICREYNICREWLDDGIEPMHPTKELNDIALIVKAMEGQSESKKELIRMLASMPDELLDQFLDFLKSKLL